MHASNSSPWAEMASREISCNNVCHHAQERPCPHSHARAVFFAFLTPVKNVYGVRASSRLLLLALAWRGFRSHPFPHHRRHMLASPAMFRVRACALLCDGVPKGGSGVLTTLAPLGGRAWWQHHDCGRQDARRVDERANRTARLALLPTSPGPDAQACAER